MSKISLCMIIKNEEEILERCLKSVEKIADEIIIVDTGSTDRSKEIAKKYTDKIYDFAWCNDFSKARNFSLSYATCEYIMWLDADDVVPLKTKKELLKLKSNMTADVYMLKYKIITDNKASSLEYYRERIIKNCQHCIWQGCVHECITPFGKIEKLNLNIEHRKLKPSTPRRNLNIYENIKKDRALNPREQYYYARELCDNKKYKKSISEFKKFINSKQGWIENVIDSYYMIANCYVYLNQLEKATKYLLESFTITEPRANICCMLGDIFMTNNNFMLSEYWYKMAIKCKDITSSGAFVQKIYYNYYPHLQLCVCYYKQGNISKALFHNEKAGKYISNDIIKNNRDFLNNQLSNL